MIVTSVGTDARTRAALRTTMHDKRFGELREGVWMRPDNLDLDLDPEVASGFGCSRRATTHPPSWPASCGTCPGGREPAIGCSTRWLPASDIPGRFVVAAAMVRHLLTDPMLPAELLPADWPGARLRAAYHDFATELARRDDEPRPNSWRRHE